MNGFDLKALVGWDVFFPCNIGSPRQADEWFWIKRLGCGCREG